MFTHIMVPVDLAHADKLGRALKVAADLAQHHAAKVTYVGVTAAQPGSVAHNPKEFAEKLAQFAADQGIETADGHAITAHDPSADLDGALAKAADDLGCDLIVMGSHIPRRLDLGSHGGHLAKLTSKSIFLVRDAA